MTKNIADRLKKLRADTGWSQEFAAKMLKIHPITVIWKAGEPRTKRAFAYMTGVAKKVSSDVKYW